MGALFSSGSTGSIRQKLVDDNYIEAIIEFPKNMLFPYASVATALVILKKNKVNDDIIMINSKDFFMKIIKGFTITDENVQRITEIYRNREVIEGILSRKKSQQKMDITYVQRSMLHLKQVKELL